ncbi:MAG: beta-ketoacyl synthase N-terminal-like domain-containing protein, partial [Pseudomonadota bacterium]
MNVAALRQPPPRARTVTIEFAEKSIDVAYHRLGELLHDDAEMRLDRAIGNVVEEALDAAELTKAQIENMALIIGTSSMDISVSEAIYRRQLAEQSNAKPMTGNIRIGALADKTRQRFGIKGQDLTLNTACTASANAFVYADRLVRSGRENHVLVIGVEVFNLITAMGFSSLELLTPTQDHRRTPFAERQPVSRSVEWFHCRRRQQ